MLAGLEALATMVWLTRPDRREPPGACRHSNETSLERVFERPRFLRCPELDLAKC